MSVVLVVFGFLTTIIMSSAIILNSWIKFADNQIDRRQSRINQQKFIINLNNQIKQLNKNIALQKKSKNNNVIIDVECEIVEESNTQTKYLYLDNNH